MSNNGALQAFDKPPAPARAASTAIAAATQRQTAEVQAAMTIAKSFPRNMHEAGARIVKSCGRYALADEALFAYPRGGQTITGPSIRLAEVIAQQWGNLDFGVVELERRNGVSLMQAYCWDLETNTRCVKTFEVEHTRKARGRVETLTDPRDVYEHVANYSARRMRACILQIIPRDVTDAAVQACERTLAAGPTDANGKPLQTRDERIRGVVEAFDGVGVSVAELEAYIGRPTLQFTDRDVVGLRAVYKSLRDDPGTRPKFFGGGPADVVSDLNAQFAPGAGAPAPAQPPAVVAPAPAIPPSDGGDGPADAEAYEPGADDDDGGDIPEKTDARLIDSSASAGPHIPAKTLAALEQVGVLSVNDVRAFVAATEDATAALAEVDGVTARGAAAVLAFCAKFGGVGPL